MADMTASRREVLKARQNDQALDQFLWNSDAQIWQRAETLSPKARTEVLDVWATDRATREVNGWSDTWRKVKSFTHGVVRGTFVGLFGEHIKAARDAGLHTINNDWGKPYDAALAYHRAVNATLAQEEGGLNSTGMITGFGSQILVPALSISGTTAASANATTKALQAANIAEKAKTVSFTALQGPIYLVPLAGTRLGNMTRIGATDAAAYGTVGYALSDGDYYRTTDSMIDGAILGTAIGGIVPPLRTARGMLRARAVSAEADEISAAASLPAVPARPQAAAQPTAPGVSP